MIDKSRNLIDVRIKYGDNELILRSDEDGYKIINGDGEIKEISEEEYCSEISDLFNLKEKI